jgi:hypothetical protein
MPAAAPDAPPPAAPPAAVAPPPPPAPPAPPSQRPAWLVPAAIAAAALVLIAIFVSMGGDDEKDAGGGETVATTKTTAGAKSFRAADAFPGDAHFSIANGGQWDRDRLCEGSGDGPLEGEGECPEDLDDFNFVCGDEFLGGTVSEERAVAKPVSVAEAHMSGRDPSAAVVLQARVYETDDGAQRALDEVSEYYRGECSDGVSSAYSPMAVARSETPLGDDYIAFAEISLGSESGLEVDHVWMRKGRVLVSLEVTHEEDLAEDFYVRLANQISAQTRDAN